MLLTDKQVAVIGGGPVGLTFAKLIQQAGVHVRVYEWDGDEQVRIQGGTLDLTEELGQKTLEKAGLLDDYYRQARAVPLRFLDGQGKPEMEDIVNETDPEIDRHDLRLILLRSLETGTVIWNRKLVRLEPQGESFLLHFDQGITETADIVIGANGIASNVRPYVTNTLATYTGSVAITGEIGDYLNRCPQFGQLSGGGMTLTTYERKFFVAQPKATGALYYYLSFAQPETWLRDNGLQVNNKHQMRQFIQDMLTDWHPAYQELADATDEFGFLPMRLVQPGHWHAHQNITLIGDAAHGTPPYAGGGVNHGLADAGQLADHLLNGPFDSIPLAMRQYEQQRLPHWLAAQAESNQNEKAIFVDGLTYRDIILGNV